MEAHDCRRQHCCCRWERSGFDAQYGRLSDQLHRLTAEVETAVTSLDIARTVERHATAETEVLKAQNDAEQASTPCALSQRLVVPSAAVACCRSPMLYRSMSSLPLGGMLMWCWFVVHCACATIRWSLLVQLSL